MPVKKISWKNPDCKCKNTSYSPPSESEIQQRRERLDFKQKYDVYLPENRALDSHELEKIADSIGKKIFVSSAFSLSQEKLDEIIRGIIVPTASLVLCPVYPATRMQNTMRLIRLHKKPYFFLCTSVEQETLIPVYCNLDTDNNRGTILLDSDPTLPELRKALTKFYQTRLSNPDDLIQTVSMSRQNLNTPSLSLRS